jgi:putative ABC transport system permease protein
MLKNYLIITGRKIMHQKMYSIINIGGLAIGIACFMLISMYVKHEMSYDRFHKNHENIYRVYRIENESAGKVKNAATPHALPKALINDYPNLENVVSVLSPRQDEIKVGENVFKEKILFASPNFFDMFDFPFVTGSQKQLWENIHSIIITRRLAKKLFGDVAPFGKSVTVHNQIELTVAGILEDIPANSSFQFDAFISNDLAYRYILPEEETKWYSMGTETFVEFSSGLSPKALNAQFPTFLNKYLPDYLKGRIALDLQPLKEIHTNTEIRGSNFPAVSKFLLSVFFLIACTILAIACINFINLATAKHAERQKEIGVRKVTGANRWQLVQQFFTESVITTLCALVIGYILLQLMLPYFNQYVQQPLNGRLFNNSRFFIIAIVFGLVLGVMNGLYPALLLSAGKPASILRKDRKKIFGFVKLRHLLVTIQFGITIALLFGVISITHQIYFMKNHDLGFLSENLIAISTNTHPVEKADGQKIDLFTEVINNQGQSHGIVTAAVSENVPGSYFPNQFSVIPEGGSEQDRIEMIITRNVSNDFIDTYQIQVKQGRNFSGTMSTDQKEAAIINETAAKQFGWDNPVGKCFRFAFAPNLFRIIGVFQDIHFHSLQTQVEPLIFVQYGDWGPKNFVTVRVHPDNIQNSLDYLKKEWNNVFPSFPFEYQFVEDMYRNSYVKEEKLLKIVTTFAVLAIILALSGLLGLTAIIAVKRTKEIGVRKTLGASVSDILLLLSRDSILTVAMASIITLPIASYGVKGWLQNFPYRIEINWWIFALSGSIAVLIAMLAISWQAIRAATANPVEALRYE